MPKLEPKAIQKELEQGQLWPVYWIHGLERMKVREIVKRIRKAAVPESGDWAGVGQEIFDGAEVSTQALLDAALSPTLGGGTRFLQIRDAHALKDLDALAPLLGPRAKAGELDHVCLFISKDLDGRKKFSKLLLEKAAVVPCEEVGETEREAWVGYLASRRGLKLAPALAAQLAVIDPWSLDIIDQELEKLSLAQLEPGAGEATAVPAGAASLGSLGVGGDATEIFLDRFFRRKKAELLPRIAELADRPDESLPLLGLLAWNTRQLMIYLSSSGGRAAPPYLVSKLASWSQFWKPSEVVGLQEQLATLDFALKQRPLLPLGLWDELVLRFC